MNNFEAGSLGAATAHRIKWILSGQQMRQWQQALQAEQIIHAGPKRVSPLSAFQITETKEGGMMVITTRRITQMHDIVKANGWEKSLRKHEKITMKYRATRSLQHVVTISVEAKTSVCQRLLPCPPLVFLPLCTPLSPLLLQAPRCQAWIHHAHHCTRCEVASPQVEAKQARHGPVCLKQLLSRTDES